MPRSFRLPPSVPAHGASTKEGRRKPLPPPCARHSPPRRHAPLVLSARTGTAFRAWQESPPERRGKSLLPHMKISHVCMLLLSLPCTMNRLPARRMYEAHSERVPSGRRARSEQTPYTTAPHTAPAPNSHNASGQTLRHRSAQPAASPAWP